MTELYNREYLQKLKKKRHVMRVAYALLLGVFAVGYVLSITELGKEWLTMLIGIFGVLVVTSFYLALLAPIRVVFRMLREARLGLRTKEALTFQAKNDEEKVKEGITYIQYNFYGRDENGVPFMREILVDKVFDPIGFIKDNTYHLETYLGILLSYKTF